MEAARHERRHLPSFGDVLEDNPKSELFGQAQGGQDVVVTVGMKMDDALAFHRFDQSLERQVARGQLCGVTLGARWAAIR